MSVAEFRGPQGGDERNPELGFDRTPPQDLAAEQCVLGAMMLSKDAIADVSETLRGTDFYRPAHEVVYDAVTDLYARGEPADAITVAAELTKRGEMARIGGAPYLHTLVASVPVAANAGYYAHIVREKSILRRLVEAGTRIVQTAYAGEGQVDDVVDQAQAEVYSVTDRRTSEDYAPLKDIMESTLDEIEAIDSRGDQMVGVPTGFTDLDELTNGLHPGQMIIVAARPAMGKALALDTPLPTPTGWTTMGQVTPGDLLLGPDGRPTRVVAATDVMVGRPCYELTFSDGSTIVADAGHQWLTRTRASRNSGQPAACGPDRMPLAEVRTTAEIAATVQCPGSTRRLNHSVGNSAPLQFGTARLPAAPYAFGVWLGDAHSASARFTAADPEILSPPEAAGPAGDRHIPTAYLRASESQRRELLAGLMDAGGTVTPAGSCQIAFTDQRLAGDVFELVVSLGYQCGHRASGRPAVEHVLTFGAADDVFTLHRKQIAHKERRLQSTVRIGNRWIKRVERIDSVPVRCVEVDNPRHLYLAGRSMIPTHNSTLGLDFARSASIKNGLTSVIFSLEMSRTEITMRLLSAEAKVPLHHMRNGKMSDEDWARLARKMGEVSEAPLFIDDSPNMTMMEIRAKARRLKQRHDLKMIIIDYMQLMSSGKKVESRQLEVSEFSRSIKLLAKELELPVIAISQLNRGAEQRTDKRPMLSDLRESGCLTADTRIMRADTGAEVSLGELLESGARDIPVWSLDDRLKLVPRTMTHVFPSGVKEVFRLRLASGREIKATANHPFLTYDGWRPLGELAPGSRIGSLRHVPPPLEVTSWDDDEVLLAVAAAAHQKFVPAGVFGLPKEQLGAFVRHLWATDGSVRWDPRAGQGHVYYASTSRQLVDDLARLLLRFNVFTRIKTARKSGYRDTYHLHIYGAENQLRFCNEIGVHGARGLKVRELALALRDVRANTNLDTVPKEVWADVRAALVERQMSHRQFATAMGTRFCGSAMWKPAPSRQRLAKVAEILDDVDLDVLATNDIFWDTVVSVEALGSQEVFDATVLGTHNFVASGVSVHNSLEQDADMVILLHREDAYERESTRPGEADFIVAKHRNGPTANVVVAFQGHYSRFVDMAHDG